MQLYGTCFLLRVFYSNKDFWAMLMIKIINSYRIHFFSVQRKLTAHCHFLLTPKLPGKNEQTKSKSLHLSRESSLEASEWLETAPKNIHPSYSGKVKEMSGGSLRLHNEKLFSCHSFMYFYLFIYPATCCSWNTALNRHFMVQMVNTCTSECGGVWPLTVRA